MENVNEDWLDLPYGCTNGITNRTAVFGGEPHDHHQGRIQEFAMGVPEFMVSAERKPRLGIWGFAPSGVQWQSP